MILIWLIDLFGFDLSWLDSCMHVSIDNKMVQWCNHLQSNQIKLKSINQSNIQTVNQIKSNQQNI